LTCPARIKRLLMAFLVFFLLLIGELMAWSMVMMSPLQKYYLSSLV
jgi:hypothetical protein